MPELTYRRATEADLPAIVALLADDVLGATREGASTVPTSEYLSAFAEIDRDANEFVCVVEEGSDVIGTLQITLIRCLSRGGAKRGQIEGVRVAGERRGQGVGEAMFRWAIGYCRSNGCSIVQLTTDRSRSDAHRFYDRLGFEATHLGYKLML